MSDSKIHIIKLLMKPNLLVRKLNKDKEQRKALFAKKKKKKKKKILKKKKKKKKSNYVYLQFV